MREQQCFAFGPFRLDLGDERLWRGPEVLSLHSKPFAVLCCLVTQAGQLVTKEAMLEAVWPEMVVSESVIPAAMRTLRRVLGDQARTPQFIETVHGRGYRFIAPVRTLASATGSAIVRAPHSGMPPLFRRPPYFVGRDAALVQLEKWWTTARHGTRQVGMIVGEAGMGKTALVDTFVAHLAATEALWVGHGQCIDHYGAGEPYLPVLEALGRLCRAPEGASLVALLRQYAPNWLLQMPALLPPMDREALERIAGGATPARMLRELTEALDRLTTERPLVLVLEDLHWSDVSTLAWLTYVARRRDPARLLILGTYRPGDAMVRAHPVRTAMTELIQHQQAAELVLDALSAADVAVYFCKRLHVSELPDALGHMLHQRTRGHPLFLVMIVDEILRQGLLGEDATRWDIAKAVETVRGTVPESLRQTIEQQLRQLNPEDQGLLEAASIAGIAFSAAAVAAGLNQSIEDIEGRLALLAHQGQFIQPCGPVEWPDGTVAAGYAFLHDLYRTILSDRILPSRRRRWHLQIGARKERGYRARAREMAAELAEHFVQGHDPHQAVQYLCYAGENAVRRSAYQEAVTHLTKSVEILQMLRETPERHQRELSILTTLGQALMAIRGFAAPDVEHIYNRAHALSEQFAEPPQLIPVLHGLWVFYLARAPLTKARALAEQLCALAQRWQKTAAWVAVHDVLGSTLYFLGELSLARAHIKQALALYTPQQRRSSALLRWREDAGIACRCHGTHILWLLGYPDQAWQQSQEALALAQELEHPLSIAFAFSHAARLHQFRREIQGVYEHAEAVMALATAQGLPHYVAWGMILRGWALTAQAQGAEGMAQIEQGFALHRATGAQVYQPYLLALLAEVLGMSGRADEGLPILAAALRLVDTNKEEWWAAELYRLQGELLLRQTLSAAAQAEANFHQALAVARRQQAKSLELRAAMSLSRLWQQQGKRDVARELLAAIYSWFTEGFDTADLQEAKTLLEDLG